MIDTISPYALLKASQPKPPAAYVTDYDLYSAAQQPHAAPPSPPPFENDTAQNTHNVPFSRQAPVSSSPKPTSRTHYIADIHNRHCRALSKAQLSSAALFAQPSSPASAHMPSQ